MYAGLCVCVWQIIYSIFFLTYFSQWMLHRFLFDVGSKIFVWTGKKANSSDKVAALGAADRYAAIEPRANDVPVTILKGT